MFRHRSYACFEKHREYIRMLIRHPERHRTEHIGWLRAAVLRANDGIVSTASLMVGVAASNAAASQILVAGAMSMAAGEFVSVSSQSNTEHADLERERKDRNELDSTPSHAVESSSQPAGRTLRKGAVIFRGSGFA